MVRVAITLLLPLVSASVQAQERLALLVGNQ
jgi:hypothetical protein